MTGFRGCVINEICGVVECKTNQTANKRVTVGRVMMMRERKPAEG